MKWNIFQCLLHHSTKFWNIRQTSVYLSSMYLHMFDILYKRSLLTKLGIFIKYLLPFQDMQNCRQIIRQAQYIRGKAFYTVF